MTTGKGPVDGFGESVGTQVAEGILSVAMYGCAPADMEPWPPPLAPWVPPPGSGGPILPPITTTFTPAFKPERFVLTVTGPNGTELTVAMTAEQWTAVRAAVLAALK